MRGPLIHRFPACEILTSRLRIRDFRLGDIPDLALAATDETIQRWLPLPKPYTLAHAEQWCTVTAPRAFEEGTGLELAVEDRGTKELIGSVRLKSTNWLTSVTEIGYWISPGGRGRGYATEAVGELSAWTFSSSPIERIELLAATENTASQRVAERCGYVREGVLRRAGITHLGRVDLVMYSLLKD